MREGLTPSCKQMLGGIFSPFFSSETTKNAMNLQILGVNIFLQLGVRPSLIPLLCSYLSDRSMRVKFNGEVSELFALIGGGHQGTLLGQTEYLVQSNDNADCVEPDDRFKYIDDLSILQLLCLSGMLVEYYFKSHVASDVGIDQKFLPADRFETHECLDTIST